MSPEMTAGLPRWRTVAVTVLCAVALTGCSGGSTSDTAQSPAGSGSSSTSPVTPSTTTTTTAVEAGTTPPGTTLKLGEPAVVRYTANPTHDSLIKLTVETLKQGKLTDLKGFLLSNSAKRSSIYYVAATVKNTGDGDLGGEPLQVYGKVSRTLVVPPQIFGATFQTCDDQPLPTPFAHGDRASVCIVLMAPHHGKVSAVQWRPADNSEPITWTARH